MFMTHIGHDWAGDTTDNKSRAWGAGLNAYPVSFSLFPSGGERTGHAYPVVSHRDTSIAFLPRKQILDAFPLVGP